MNGGGPKTNNSHDEKQKCIAGAAEDDQGHQSDSWASHGTEPSGQFNLQGEVCKISDHDFIALCMRWLHNPTMFDFAPVMVKNDYVTPEASF